MLSKTIHVIAYVRTSFPFTAEENSAPVVSKRILPIHSWALGCFQLWAIVNTVTINSDIQVFMWAFILTSLGCIQKLMPSSKITFTGSHSRSKQYHFSSLPGVCEGVYFSTYPTVLVVFDSFCSGHPGGQGMILIFSFLMTYNVHHLFMCCWPFVYLLKRNTPARSLDPLFRLVGMYH